MAQTKINAFSSPPTLKNGVESKTASEVKIIDLVAPIASDLTIIIAVDRSSTTPNGSVVTVTLEVSSTVSGTNSQTYKVELVGFTTKATKDILDINSVKTLIEEITGMTKTTSADINAVSSELPFDVSALCSLGTNGDFPTDIKNTILTNTHGGRTSDGTLAITVKIEKGEALDVAIFNVDVDGIDVAKRNVQIAADIASVKVAIGQIIGMKKTVNVAILKTSSAQPFNVSILGTLGIGGTFPNDIKNTVLTYTHGGITSDGTLAVIVKIVKENVSDTATFNIKVTGIDQAIKDAQTDIDKVANDFKKSKRGFNAVDDPQNPEIINHIDLHTIWPSMIKWNNLPEEVFYRQSYGTTITYTLETQNDTEGTLVVKATIAKGLAISKAIKFKLGVFLTPSKAIEYCIQEFKKSWNMSAVDVSENPILIKITTLPSASTTLPSELNEKTTPAEIGFIALKWYDGMLSLEDKFKVVINYNVETYDDASGTLIVKVTITKQGVNPGIVKFKLGGFKRAS